MQRASNFGLWLFNSLIYSGLQSFCLFLSKKQHFFNLTPLFDTTIIWLFFFSYICIECFNYTPSQRSIILDIIAKDIEEM